eukprot:s1890_g14.t1
MNPCPFWLVLCLTSVDLGDLRDSHLQLGGDIAGSICSWPTGQSWKRHKNQAALLRPHTLPGTEPQLAVLVPEAVARWCLPFT